MNEIKQVLEKEAYFKTDWYEKEKELIFEKEWQFISFIESLKEEKSFILKTVGNTPIIVVNENGKINAFVNMCTHRGMRLLRGDEKLNSSIICPYHNWNFNLKGELKGIPQGKEFGNIDKGCLGLKKVQCEVWQDMIFINLNLKAEPLSAILNPIKNRIFPYDDKNELEFNDGYSYIINSNWKIFVENYMDVYHLSHIHKESLKEYDHKNSDYEFINRQWLFYQPLTKEGSNSSSWWDGYMGKLKSFNGDKGAYVSMLFPNFGITATENMCIYVSINPISSTETKIDVYIKSSSGSKKYKMPIVYDYREKKISKEKLLSKPDVMNEDIYACEMIQKNINSSFFKVSTLAQKLEKPLFEYQNFIKNCIVNN